MPIQHPEYAVYQQHAAFHSKAPPFLADLMRYRLQ